MAAPAYVVVRERAYLGPRWFVFEGKYSKAYWARLPEYARHMTAEEAAKVVEKHGGTAVLAEKESK